MSLTAYTVSWNDELLPIQEAIQRILSGIHPESLIISHPQQSSISVSRPGMYGSEYIVSRSGPALPGIGIRRTFANIPIDHEGLIPYIFDIYYSLESELAGLNIARNKLTRLQVEAAKKMANRAEGADGKNIPPEVRARIAQMLGEKAPVKGSNIVLKNFSKINTNLFQGGKKRKATRKARKARKITRRIR
jgi:hypothetical protein